MASRAVAANSKKSDDRHAREFDRITAEYVELCADWRQRDGALWQSISQSLVVTTSVTGLTVGYALTVIAAPWLVKAALFAVAFSMNFLVLLKSVKDNYYQHGSSELIQKIQVEVKASLGVDLHAKNLRIRTPSYMYRDERLDKLRPRWLYFWLTKRSTFQVIFGIQTAFVAITLIGVVACLVMAIVAPVLLAPGPLGLHL